MTPRHRKVSYIKKIIFSDSEKQILHFLESLKSDDYSEIFSSLSPQEIERFVEVVFKSQNLSQTIKEIPDVILPEMLDIIPIKTLTEVLIAAPEKLASLLVKKISREREKVIFDQLPPAQVKRFERFLMYPEDTCGYIMSPDFFSISQESPAGQAVEGLRKFAHNDHIVYIYVLDETRLVGVVSLRDLFLAEPSTLVRDLMSRKLVTIHVNDDREKAAGLVAQYNYLAIPVVNDQLEILGIIKVDDIVDVIRDEFTEDIQKIGGTEALDEPYMTMPFRGLLRKRAGWLTILFLGEMLTATAMGFFQNRIERAVVLALFVPLIISSGGNSGSQASTLVIRSLAIGEITLKDWYKVLRRELGAGLSLGLLLGGIGFIRVTLWSLVSNIYGPHWFLVACTIFTSLIGVVLWGTIAGSMLPFVLKKLGFDPAASSAPFVATLVDVTGLVIYFTAASLILFQVLV